MLYQQPSLWWDSGKESACPCRRCKKCGFNPWVGKTPWSTKRQPTPVFLPGKFHGQGSLAGYSPWDHKELDTTEQVNTHTYIPVFCGSYSQVYLLHTFAKKNSDVLRNCEFTEAEFSIISSLQYSENFLRFSQSEIL